jgi:hypothetical protein
MTPHVVLKPAKMQVTKCGHHKRKPMPMRQYREGENAWPDEQNTQGVALEAHAAGITGASGLDTIQKSRVNPQASAGGMHAQLTS